VQIGFLRIKSIYLTISGHSHLFKSDSPGSNRFIWPFFRGDFHWDSKTNQTDTNNHVLNLNHHLSVVSDCFFAASGGFPTYFREGAYSFIYLMLLPDHTIATNLGDLGKGPPWFGDCANYSTSGVSPISKLPEEILLSIFLMNLTPCRYFSTCLEWQEQTTRSVSQVCRHWRAVALNYPILWTSIMDFDKDSFEWTQELLGRSKQMPLNIGCPIAACRPKNLDLVLDFGPQCRTFCLEVEAFTEGFLNAIQKPAPHLEVFGVHLKWGEAGVTTLPKILFNGDAPKLREVHLKWCRFDVTTLAFSQLTCLEVSWAHGFVGPTVSEWLNLLNNIPRLKKLILKSISKTLPSTEPLPRAQLPHLSDLGLSAPLAECSRFLSHIDIPPLERLSLTTYELRSNPDLQFIVRFLRERMDGWARNIVNCECLAFLDSHSLSLGGSNHHPSDPDLRVTFDWKGSAPDQTTDPLTYFSHPLIMLFLPIFRSARSLHMHYLLDDGPSNSMLAVYILSFFHNLETLRLTGSVHITLLPLFERSTVSFTDFQEFLLPSLRALVFCVCDFKIDDGHGLKVLRAFLEFRAEIGIPIKTISFKYCNLDEGCQSIGEEFGIDISH